MKINEKRTKLMTIARRAINGRMNITIRNIILEYYHRSLGESEFVMGDVTIGYFRKLQS